MSKTAGGIFLTHTVDTYRHSTYCVECYRSHGWLVTTPKIDRNRCMPKIRTRYTGWTKKTAPNFSCNSFGK